MNQYEKNGKTSFLSIFKKTAYWFSLIFCMNASLRECKKVTFFSGKLENWTFWAKSVKNWNFYGFLGVPRNGCFSLSLRCTRFGPRMTASLNLYFDHFLYLSLSISHFNLEYLDLCKFKLFDEPL